jgi:hypothetical protein
MVLQPQFDWHVLLRDRPSFFVQRLALDMNCCQGERWFETKPDVASMRASFVLVLIWRVVLSDRTTQLLRRYALGTNRNQLLLQHMLYWHVVLRDHPSQLFRRLALNTGRN